MAQEMDRPVRTFSVGFEEAAFDERPFARLVAQRYATDHTELVVKAPVRDILPRLVWHYDEPFGDASAVPSYAIAELTRQHITVVLNGDGGDESFAGYDRYIADRRARRWDVVPWEWRRRLEAVIHCLPPDWLRRQPLRKFTNVAEVMALSPEHRYVRWFGHFMPHERQKLYTDAFNAAVLGSDPEARFAEAFDQTDAEDWTDAALDVDVNLYLADDLLVKMDRATMAHSLEARSPFLDHELMEFVASLPPAMKLAGTQRKRVLKASLRGLVPYAVLERPKMGFSAPISNWFREDLREMAHDILLSPRALQRGYFLPKVLATLLDEHCMGREDHAEDLWALLVLELWHRTFIDGEGSGSPTTAR
jgi:asparagine synthase (glutamine-hydrolysing)